MMLSSLPETENTQVLAIASHVGSVQSKSARVLNILRWFTGDYYWHCFINRPLIRLQLCR
jgi:hypothetical protein